MIKIYGPSGSSAGRCYWTLEEVGVAYESIPIDFRNKDHKKPEYLKLNPNGKVPLLQDGDVVLWESMAINHYLAEKYKPALLGGSVEDRAHILKWSFWALAEYQKPIIDAFIQKVFVPEAKRDHGIIARSLDELKPLHDTLETCLKGRDYLVGSGFTLADINVASVTKLCPLIGADLAAYPAIQAWLNHVLDRPAVHKIAAMDKH